MSKVTVWKRVLKCISVKNWEWEYAIAELECEESLILKFSSGKCRVPSVTVVGIKPLPSNYATFVASDGRALYAADAAALDAARWPAVLDADRVSNYAPIVLWDYSKSWRYNYGNCNYTKLSDGDVVSWYDHTRWVVGETVTSTTWDPSPDNQCSSGIHVFLTREEAENYNF